MSARRAAADRPAAPTRSAPADDLVQALGLQAQRAAQALLATDRAQAETEVKAMCEKLLANTVIESYRVELL